jgi:hypothetical protein
VAESRGADRPLQGVEGGRASCPYRPIRHGPTLSLYYRDPDGNQLEFQIDLLAPEAANDFLRGEAFKANPIGEPSIPTSSWPAWNPAPPRAS